MSTIAPDDGTPAVRCYGCGRRYNPLDAAESHHHTHHAGPVFPWARPRRGWLRLRRRHIDGMFPAAVVETATAWLDECQAERDAALRRAHTLEDEAARRRRSSVRDVARRGVDLLVDPHRWHAGQPVTEPTPMPVDLAPDRPPAP